MLPSPQVKLFRHGNRGEDSPDEGKIKVKSPSGKLRLICCYEACLALI